MDEASWWRPHPVGITISVRVTPGARRSDVGDVIEGRLRLRIAAPAVDGKANVALAKFVGDLFGVRATAVSVVHGPHSRDKTLVVRGVERPPASLTT